VRGMQPCLNAVVERWWFWKAEIARMVDKQRGRSGFGQGRWQKENCDDRFVDYAKEGDSVR
jgi:hypothetical protein